MRFLLDTHLAIWLLMDDRRASSSLRELVRDEGNAFAVSAASIWEIAIKHALNRGNANDLPLSGPAAVDAFRTSGYEFLPVTPEHAAAVGSLPTLHADPFDRLLIAQSIVEGITLLTGDGMVASYSTAIRRV